MNARYLPRAGAALLLAVTVAVAVALPATTAAAAAGASRRTGPAGVTPSSDVRAPSAGQAPSGTEPLSRAQILAGLQPSSAQPAVTCSSPSGTHRSLAGRLARGVSAALRGRSSIVGLAVADMRTGVTCALHPGWHFDSASVVKVTILGALLRKLETEHKYLTPAQITLTTEMITESDNDAASALWAAVGRSHLQQFLDLANMRHTVLGEGGYWGLTQITAHDELTLLELLASKNNVLDTSSRQYALSLMARVIPSQRWGTPAGVPAGVKVHVKNGWLPLPTYGWRINSIGSFSGNGRNYMIVILTKNNPTMDYGVDTIERAAKVINHSLG
jgi:beta-lactamase class A